jgi:hypothetical protein
MSKKNTSKRNTGPTRKRHDPAPQVPQLYETPDGVRLNIAAILEKYPSLTRPAFRMRQFQGWRSLNGGKLQDVQMLGTPSNGRRVWESTFLEREVDEAMRPRGPRGSWLPSAKGLIWRSGDGRLWFTAKVIRPDERYRILRHSALFNWANKYPCPHLDPKDNDGFVHSLMVHDGTRIPFRVFLQTDLDRIVDRLSDAARRKTVPGDLGRWITNDIYQLKAPVPEMVLDIGELLYRDERLAEEIGVRMATLGDWRRNGHTALDKSVWSGRLRYLRIARPERLKGGPGKVIVSSQADGDTIREWREKQRQRAKDDTDRDGLTRAELAKHFGLHRGSWRDDQALSLVLAAFREDVPAGAWEKVLWDEAQNGPVTQLRYDKAAVVRWLDGRTVHDLAAGCTRIETPRAKERRAKRLHRATIFLVFVLTRGRWSPRTFNHFLRELPVGKKLKPCDGVWAGDVKLWARKADVGSRELHAAARQLPIVLDGGGRKRRMWRLSEPVTIPADEAAPTQLTKSSSGRPEVNQEIVAYALAAKAANPRLRGKELLKQCRERFPNHPIFESQKPAAALRAAMARARKDAPAAG